MVTSQKKLGTVSMLYNSSYGAVHPLFMAGLRRAMGVGISLMEISTKRQVEWNSDAHWN
jgi:hypothetical protein